MWNYGRKINKNRPQNPLLDPYWTPFLTPFLSIFVNFWIKMQKNRKNWKKSIFWVQKWPSDSKFNRNGPEMQKKPFFDPLHGLGFFQKNRSKMKKIEKKWGIE